MAVLLALFALVQYRLWVGERSVAEVWRLDQAVATQRADNEELRARNGRLEAEVRDLKEGVAAIEERARHDLGMVGRGETY